MDSPQQYIERLEFACRAQMDKINELRAENKRLVDWIMGDADAHTCLQAVYNNPASSEGNRIKAAAAAMPFEKPKLTSVEPPVIQVNVIPLQELYAQRRARHEAFMEGRAWPPVLELPKANGDGSDG